MCALRAYITANITHFFNYLINLSKKCVLRTKNGHNPMLCPNSEFQIWLVLFECNDDGSVHLWLCLGVHNLRFDTDLIFAYSVFFCE